MTRSQIIKTMARQSNRAIRTGRITGQPDLELLAYLAKTARPRAKSVNYRGVNWPLSHNLWSRIVVCPETRRNLVGVIDL